jgi:hypothetical protein
VCEPSWQARHAGWIAVPFGSGCTSGSYIAPVRTVNGAREEYADASCSGVPSCTYLLRINGRAGKLRGNTFARRKMQTVRGPAYRN